jgi:hypothetical protein
VFGKVFFPKSAPAAGVLLALATFGVGYLARPVGGLLRSRAVSTADGAVRVALNVAYVGSHPSAPDIPWQHVALGSRDIVATARRLSAAPNLLLPIPDNYYDDLEARHDLGAERHRTLRELGLLYDRDGLGEFPSPLHADDRTRLLRDRPAHRRLPGVRSGQRADPPGRPARPYPHCPRLSGQPRWVGRIERGIGPLLRRPCWVSSHACARMPTLLLRTNRPRASGAGKPSSA